MGAGHRALPGLGDDVCDERPGPPGSAADAPCPARHARTAGSCPAHRCRAAVHRHRPVLQPRCRAPLPGRTEVRGPPHGPRPARRARPHRRAQRHAAGPVRTRGRTHAPRSPGRQPAQRRHLPSGRRPGATAAQLHQCRHREPDRRAGPRHHGRPSGLPECHPSRGPAALPADAAVLGRYAAGLRLPLSRDQARWRDPLAALPIGPPEQPRGHGLGRHHAGHHPRARGRAGAAAGQGGRRSGRTGQVGFPGHHEPRNPHPHEHRHRHDAPGSADRADITPARLPGEGGALGQRPAGRDQRRPRLFQDRGGHAGAGGSGFRP